MSPPRNESPGMACATFRPSARGIRCRDCGVPMGAHYPPPPASPPCSCFTCDGSPAFSSRMYLCALCGNKRCPHATDHHNACTGSNETGQEGSAYGAPALAYHLCPACHEDPNEGRVCPVTGLRHLRGEPSPEERDAGQEETMAFWMPTADQVLADLREHVPHASPDRGRNVVAVELFKAALRGGSAERARRAALPGGAEEMREAAARVVETHPRVSLAPALCASVATKIRALPIPPPAVPPARVPAAPVCAVCRDVMRERDGLKAKMGEGRKALDRAADDDTPARLSVGVEQALQALAALSDPAPEAS